MDKEENNNSKRNNKLAFWDVRNNAIQKAMHDFYLTLSSYSNVLDLPLPLHLSLLISIIFHILNISQHYV